MEGGGCTSHGYYSRVSGSVLQWNNFLFQYHVLHIDPLNGFYTFHKLRKGFQDVCDYKRPYLQCVTLPPTMQLQPLPRYFLSHFDSGLLSPTTHITRLNIWTVVTSVKISFNISCYIIVRRERLTTSPPSVSQVSRKMWDPRRVTTLWASMACYRDSFPSYILLFCSYKVIFT
jgi:hypothetical protein